MYRLLILSVYLSFSVNHHGQLLQRKTEQRCPDILYHSKTSDYRRYHCRRFRDDGTGIHR